MELQERLPMEPLIGGNGGRYRWVSITSLLLSVGVVIKVITPPIAGITPNWLIPMYCLAIFLSRPTLKQAAIIGLVVGCVGLCLSKSPLPFANLLCEPAGAIAGWFLIKIPLVIPIGGRKLDLRPGFSTLVATFISGGVFVSTLKIVLNLPDGFLLGMIPVVGTVAIINAAFAQVVYFPAKKLFSRLSGELVKKESPKSGGKELPPQDTTAEERAYRGIILERCSYSFDGEKRALDEVSLRIPEGVFMVVAGASGAGKTTLAAAFAGLIPHIYGGYGAGKIVVMGKANREETLAERAKVVGLVMEDVASQLVAMTVGEEVAFALENRGVPVVEIQDRVKKSLAQVGLSGLENREVNQLSGGQRQRLVVAAALAQETPILVLDEPASALDPEGREDIYRLLGELHEAQAGKLTLIVLETDISQAIRYADHLAYMEKGKILAYGTLEETLQEIGRLSAGRTLLPRAIQIRSELQEKGFENLAGQDGKALAKEIQAKLSPRKEGH
jgi:ABC-type cobalt transport system, ATPase component